MKIPEPVIFPCFSEKLLYNGKGRKEPYGGLGTLEPKQH